MCRAAGVIRLIQLKSCMINVNLTAAVSAIYRLSYTQILEYYVENNCCEVNKTSEPWPRYKTCDERNERGKFFKKLWCCVGREYTR